MIISFSGNDGSGKTTIINQLMKLFENLGFEVIYKHEYDYFLLKYLFLLYGSSRVQADRNQMLIKKKKSIKYSLWPYLVWLDSLLCFVFIKIFKRNSIVIMDRYPFDHYLSFEYLGYSSSVVKFIYSKFPKADLSFLLWAEPKIAYERKKETHSYDVRFYEIQTNRYLDMGNKLGLISIKTSDKNISSTVSIVLDYLYSNDGIKSEIMRRGFQNKTFFYVFNNYKNTHFFNKLQSEYSKRLHMFNKSINFLDSFSHMVNIPYIYIKTINRFVKFGWVGNDLDVLVPKAHFDDFISSMKNEKIIYNTSKSKSHISSFDVLINEGLPIDIHQSIDWRGVVISDDFMSFFKEKVTFKIGSLKIPTVSELIDSKICIFTHMFEKGFITYDEFLIVSKHIHSMNFEGLPFQNFFKSYRKWFLSIDPSKTAFPLFLPMILIFRFIFFSDVTYYSKFKIILLTFAWKLRYVIMKKLPFEVYLHD